MPAFVFVHSPLVGPLTWVLVVEEMRRRNISAIAPGLPDSRSITPPYWQRHAEAVARAIESAPDTHSLILVGHSGGGPLLPAIRQATGCTVAADIFVDAIIPQDGHSRLDLFESREAVKQFRASASDGLLPIWGNAEILSNVITNSERRAQFAAELRRLPLAVYEEPIPVFAGWPDAPCGYLRLSPTYQPQMAQAQRRGWACAELESGHFHMLNEPVAVTNAILDLAERLIL